MKRRLTQERSETPVTSREKKLKIENSETTKASSQGTSKLSIAASRSGFEEEDRKTVSLSSSGENFFKKYEQICVIGHGSFGIVYKVRDVQTNQELVH